MPWVKIPKPSAQSTIIFDDPVVLFDDAAVLFDGNGDANNWVKINKPTS